MKNKRIFLFLLSFIIIAMNLYAPLFGQTTDIEIDELASLELLRGRVFEISIGSGKYLILNSVREGKNYLLETKLRKELLEQLQKIAQKNWEVEISGALKGYREYKVVEFEPPQEAAIQQKGKEGLKKEGKKTILPVIDVVLINTINKDVPPKEAPNLFTTFEVPPDFQKEYSAAIILKKITGKVSKCNFKSVIPTIELEGKPSFGIIIPGDVEAVKVVGGNLIAFEPKDVIKEGTQVEIWYEEKEGLKNARIITIQEKDILSK